MSRGTAFRSAVTFLVAGLAIQLIPEQARADHGRTSYCGYTTVPYGPGHARSTVVYVEEPYVYVERVTQPRVVYYRSHHRTYPRLRRIHYLPSRRIGLSHVFRVRRDARHGGGLRLDRRHRHGRTGGFSVRIGRRR